MKKLYKEITEELNYFKHVCLIFVCLSIFFFVYICLDLHFGTKKVINLLEKDSEVSVQHGERLIYQPRLQLERGDDLHYIVSTKGTWDLESDIIRLRDVEVESTLGKISSDILIIKDNNRIMEFEGDPVFTLNLENNTEEKNDI